MGEEPQDEGACSTAKRGSQENVLSQVQTWWAVECYELVGYKMKNRERGPGPGSGQGRHPGLRGTLVWLLQAG